ncbi:MAG TPA: ZIP family metal transporter [Thermodesulfobacteriota bacterium]|nr:ZIP family metal transporter [Thermodesulfobacteriota bacterium]
MSGERVKEGGEQVSKKGPGFLRSRLGLLLVALFPLLVLALMVYWFATKGAGFIETPAFPVEKLDFERIVLRPGEIIAYVRNTGPYEVTIAQVTVNEALWEASIHPTNVIPRLGRAVITIPYHWVQYEPYEITVITSTGIRFTNRVEIATQTPIPNWRYFGIFALLGVYVGVIPIYLGFLWFPFMRRVGKKWMGFFLSLTAGLLVFLGIDTLHEAFEVAERVPGVFQGVALIAMGTLFSFLVLVTVGRKTMSSGVSNRDDSYVRLVLAYMIATGIGLHNLGEGLAIGSAYVLGEVALGAFLVIGFAIHNITEGLGIVAPVAGESKPRRIHFLLLGLLSGTPTILGTWIGGFMYSDVWATLFFAIGAGAIFQVVYEIVRLMSRESESGFGNLINLTGLVLGLLIMYITGLFVVV